jgi:hypothetical protein
MKGNVRLVRPKPSLMREGGFRLELTPESEQDKKWLLNAFYCIKVGVLSSKEGDIQSLCLWTDNNHKLRKRKCISQEQKSTKKEQP